MNCELKWVVLLGKLGHGKTRILNEICGTSYPSNMGSNSCTQVVQCGHTIRHRIGVIDTPGMGSSEDVAGHIANQKQVLENIELSGIYIVVKWGRADDIAEFLDLAMDFLGFDDVRVIITHTDAACHQEGFDEDEVKKRLSFQFDIPVKNIATVGLDTDPQFIEDFIQATLHHPTKLEIGNEQTAAVSCLSVGARRTNKPMDDAVRKIRVAAKACNHIILTHGKCYTSDMLISVTQDVTSKMVRSTKESILKDSMDNLSPEQLNIVVGRAKLHLTMQLQAFMEITNKYLTWDVSDQRNPRNQYKKCRICHKLHFLKSKKIDAKIICGSRSSSTTKNNERAEGTPSLEAAFFKSEDSSELSGEGASSKGWCLIYRVNNVEVDIADLQKAVRRAIGRDSIQKQLRQCKKKGCGTKMSWKSMYPIEPELGKEIQNHISLKYTRSDDRISIRQNGKMRTNNTSTTAPSDFHRQQQRGRFNTFFNFHLSTILNVVLAIFCVFATISGMGKTQMALNAPLEKLCDLQFSIHPLQQYLYDQQKSKKDTSASNSIVSSQIENLLRMLPIEKKSDKAATMNTMELNDEEEQGKK